MPINVLMCGTGEYTTGYTAAGASKSDKGAGVVALSKFSKGRVGIFLIGGALVSLCNPLSKPLSNPLSKPQRCST